MQYREAILLVIDEKNKKKEILISELKLVEFQLEILGQAFNTKPSELSESERFEMIILLKEVTNNDFFE